MMWMRLIAAWWLLAAPLPAQLRLSEFLASNTQSHPDVVDFEAYPDWIEIENPSGSEVSLQGWFLSDDAGNPLKWAFPDSATIPASGRLVVWADGYAAAPGETHPRGYWPWRNFTTEGYHTNFSLSAEGESVVLTRVSGLSTLPLITAGTPPPDPPATASLWKYLDDGSDQNSSWRSRNFDDSPWAAGAGQLGYGDDDETTLVAGGPDSSTRHVTTYFRHSFPVADPSLIASLTLRLLVDDGAVVYLNGTEVVRQNLPAGEINYRTLALSAIGGAAESAFTAYSVPASLLQPGLNVLAVEVHQSAANSSDVSFDLSLQATAFNSVTIVDQYAYGTQLPDVSMGRNHREQWVHFANPTPGAPNPDDDGTDIRQTGASASFTPPAGVYPQPQTVTLSAPSGTIRYTLDGSLPKINSPAYQAPITLTTTTVVRARVFETGKPNGPVETRTYFIGETQGSLPYVSVVSDPEALFGSRIGIYYNQHEPLVSSGSNAALGLRDVYKGKDAPGSLEFFAPGGAPGFRVNGGYRIGGENNWVHAQRALNFALRGRYGDDTIPYRLFPNTSIPLHASLTLRDGGDAWDKEMLRDGMWPFLVQNQMKADSYDYRPSEVFINGSYWGIHNLRARWDDTWFFEQKRLNADQIDHLLYGHLTSSSVTLGADKGDTASWLELLDFLRNNDLNVPENFAFAESRINLDSFIDFVAAESYGINTSWHHNREFWRPRQPGGKWHWFLPDMDQTFRPSQLGNSVLNDMLSRDNLLVRLKTSTAFRDRLAQRFAAHVASTFHPSRISAIVDGMAAEVEAAVPRHIARWREFGGMTASGRASYIQGIKDFAAARDASIHEEIRSSLGLDTPAVDLTLELAGAEGGRVLLNGVPIQPGTIRLFPGIPFELTAEPAPGFRFHQWTGAAGTTSEPTTTATLSGPAAITAAFLPSGETSIGGTLTADTTLSADASPYTLTADLVVPPSLTLTVQPGVTLLLPHGRHLRVQGSLQVRGTAEAPVRLLGRNGARWGGLSFENPTAPSALSHLIIRGATRGADPVTFPYALSGLNAILAIDHLDIDECDGPVFCRGGSLILRQSRLHTPYTGDCINVKAGYAETHDCVFIGNNAPDTDAIDYDGVVNGIISGCRIYRFQGPNCDGIDIGEACSNILIENNLIYFNSDKGVSVGQASTVVMRRNLVVGCVLGVGIKDSGSHVTIDQNTFVNCEVGVDAYEKNFAGGGATAVITNTIFSKCSITPVRADAFSSLTTSYSLSDTTPMTGTGNLLASPLFIDPGLLNFQLQPASPAIDAGDPSHAPDPDGSRADIGPSYVYNPSDYPYALTATVVIDEILANSGAEASDWIELLNRSSSTVDLGGWFLSDSGSDLQKYRIPEGTVLAPGARVVFSEDRHFGQSSLDPGRISPFALSDVGETVYLSSAQNNQLTDYQTKEDFGPSLPGESLGNYYKSSTDSWNFVALQSPTPGLENSPPRVGPVVISEIMFAPAGHPDAEYLELTNISETPVNMFDDSRSAGWRLTHGLEYQFPSQPPVIIAPGERLLLVKNRSLFQAQFNPPATTTVLEWTSGRLSNEGETVQLGRPAGLDDTGVRQFARVDRVAYGISAPWPADSSSTGRSLTRIADADYGNDPANWVSAPATPGTAAATPVEFADWISTTGLPPSEQSPDADPDLDGTPNALEFALGGDPTTPETQPPLTLSVSPTESAISFDLRTDRPGVQVILESSPSLQPDSWIEVPTQTSPPVGTQQKHTALIPPGEDHAFFRLKAR